jgi:Mg2+ and Co2+ transporter CorA
MKYLARRKHILWAVLIILVILYLIVGVWMKAH